MAFFDLDAFSLEMCIAKAFAHTILDEGRLQTAAERRASELRPRAMYPRLCHKR